MLEDSLSKYAPGVGFSEPCAAVLKNSLHFPAAAVERIFEPGIWGNRMRILIILVEPEAAAGVRYKPVNADTAADILRWSPVTTMFMGNPEGFQCAIAAYPRYLRAPSETSSLCRGLRVPIRFWQDLRDLDQPRDWVLAQQTLDHDGNYLNRVAAAAIMLNWAQLDSAWVALLDAQRDPDDKVAGIASLALGALARERARPVDWSDGASSICALLAGTNPFALKQTIRSLTATSVAPQLSAAILPRDGGLLLSLADAPNRADRETAIALLSRLSGQNLGRDVASWLLWLRSLRHARDSAQSGAQCARMANG